MTPEQARIFRERTQPIINDFVTRDWSLRQFAWAVYMRGLMDGYDVRDRAKEPRRYLLPSASSVDKRK